MKRKNTVTDEVVKVPTLSTFGASFRKRLKSNNAINELKEFIETNKHRDVITEYVNAGGNAKELVALMKQFDGKKDLIVANTVFSAVQILVNKSIDDLLLIQDDVEEVCDELLCHYISVMHNMLNSSSSTTSHRKVILKLLTGMASLSFVLAKKILTLFPMSWHLLKLLCDTRSSPSALKLRTHFINYLLSFLMHENSFLTSDLLNQKGLLASIIPGLVNDHPDTVALVLNSLRTKLVENVKISKTLKIYTFNTPVLRSLFKLYDYKTSKSKESKTDKNRDDIYEKVQLIRKEVHSLLIILCTSTKMGLLFRERNTTSGTSANQLIFTLLEDIEAPWKDDLKSQLVTEILKVCPEFLKPVLSNVEPFISPSLSTNWLNLMSFLEQVVEKQELNTNIVDDHHAANTILTLTFPSAVQKLLRACNDNAIHTHPTIRYRIIKLLELALNKMKFMVDQCETLFSNTNSVQSMRNELEKFLNENITTCSHLVNAWNLGVTIQTEIDDNIDISVPSTSEYYTTLANLFLLYQNLSPMCFSRLMKDENVNLIEIDCDDRSLLFRRAHLIFLIFNPKPGQNRFSAMLKDLIGYSFQEAVQFEKILENVFLSTGFFDGFEDEVSVWLYAVENVSQDCKTSLSRLLIDIFEKLNRNSKLFMDDITILADLDDSVVASDRNSFRYSGILENVDEEYALRYRSKPKILISPVLTALMYVLKKNKKWKTDEINEATIKEFVTYILVHSLHLQGNVQGIITLCEKYDNKFVDTCFIKYANFWRCSLPTSELISLPSNLNDVTRNLYHSLSSEKLIKSIPEMIETGTEIERKLAWDSCIFYTTRFALRGELNERRSSIALQFFNHALNVLQVENTNSCLKSLLSDAYFVDCFEPLRRNENALSQILTNLRFENDKLPEKYSKWLFPYRRKLISSLLNVIDDKISDSDVTNLEKQFAFVRIPEKTAVQLLKAYIRYSPNYKNYEVCLAVVGCSLRVISINMETALENEDFSILIAWILRIFKRANRFDDVVNDLEEKLIEYLISFPHHLHHISEDKMKKLLNRVPIVDRLALFLLTHFSEHLPLLASNIQNAGKSISVETLFEIARKVEPEYEHTVTSIIYEYYFDDVIDTLAEDESTWLHEYVNYVVKMVRNIADIDRQSDSFDNNIVKLTKGRLNPCKCAFLRAYFEKAESIANFLPILLAEANRQLPIIEIWLYREICDVIQSMREMDFQLNTFSDRDFVKQCLKIGLQSPNSELLRILKMLCQKFLSHENTAEVTAIFQMMISHSQFINVILGDSDAKNELIDLFLVLTQKNTSLMSSNHVPLLLGAYKATMSKPDQLLLQVLQWYEQNEISFTNCRPYLWGEAAVTHHSIRTEISVSLKRQPQPNQVLDLFDIDLVKDSIQQFPLDLRLNIDNVIHTEADDIYDPRFFLPLLSHLLAPESRISVQRFTRSGALSLILTSLSSNVEEIRRVGFHCLQRFSTHLTSREKEVQIWDHFVTSLKNGIQSGIKEDNEIPQLSCIFTLFLAHMCLIISEPLHSLYVSLTNFLLAKPSFDVDTIPNFLVLIYSTDLKSRDHQDWILKIIRDGMRQKQDWIVAQKCLLFKLVSQFYMTAVSNERTNVLILEIIANACQIKECNSYLISSFGLMSWLMQVVLNLPVNHKNLLPSIIKILKFTVSVKNCINSMIIALLLLRKCLFKKEEQSKLEDLLEILSIAYHYNRDNFLKEDDVEMTIRAIRPFVDETRYKKLKNCIRFKSTIGIEECDNNLSDHVLNIIRRFLNTNR